MKPGLQLLKFKLDKMGSKTAYIFSGQGFAFSDLENLSNMSYPLDIQNAYEKVFGRVLDPLVELTPATYQQNEVSAAILLTSTLSWMELSLDKPDFFAGFSIGQYIALYAAGALSRSDLIMLVFRRCKYMNEAAKMAPGAMVSVLGLAHEEVLELANKNSVWISNDNAPGNLTVAGETENLKVFCEEAKQHGAYKLQELPTSGAWHCPCMKPAVNNLVSALSDVSWKPTSIPVIDNISVSEFDIDNVEDLLSSHLIKTVRWRETIQYLYSQGTLQFVEISHFDLLSKMGPFITRKAAWKSIKNIKVH